MTPAPLWTPATSIAAECARRGRSELVSACVGILTGRPCDDELLLALAGPAAPPVLAGREGGTAGYWPRVWAARGLLHAWDATGTKAIIAATRDESWRVREMAAKVVARHLIEEALSAVVALQEDPVPRVRRAALRAVQRVAAG
ncbi:MAG: HEAT repeat domain-containing protein [Candidatus Dormibacteria bacterium]